MNFDHLNVSPETTPTVENSGSPLGAIAFSSLLERVAAAQESPSVAERRRGISEMELGSIMLAHAVRYLTSEQRAGRCTNVPSNRQAIKILCECAEQLMELERREPALKALASWMADAMPL